MNAEEKALLIKTLGQAKVEFRAAKYDSGDNATANQYESLAKDAERCVAIIEKM